MKLVRSDEIFCLLGNDTIFRRQQFGATGVSSTSRRISESAFFPAGVRIILYQMAHQRFRYGRIDSIHRHMVTVVRCPARVPNSERSPVPVIIPPDWLARSIKSGFSHARLSVFIRHIILRILSDVAEMEIDSLFDVDLF